MDFLMNNWEYFLLGFMILEKIVKLSPTDKDDIILDVIWQGLLKVTGKSK